VILRQENTPVLAFDFGLFDRRAEGFIDELVSRSNLTGSAGGAYFQTA
jgi:hypothetical protein